VQQRLTVISTRLNFFPIEVNAIDAKALNGFIASSTALAKYKPWLDKIRKTKPHQLSTKQEQVADIKNLTGYDAWVRLFDETITRLRFPLDDQELSETEILHIMNNGATSAKRQAAAHSFGRVLNANCHLFTYITNTLAQHKSLDDDLRNYGHIAASRHLANDVEQDVVEVLVTTVKNNYPKLAQRYYKLKAKWLGYEDGKLHYWDRNCPMPFGNNKEYKWQEAKHIVRSAYDDFSPQLAQLGNKFFDNNWVDVPPAMNKDAGAFAHPVVPSKHPYLLLNFKGTQRDVMTLAHELGHGVHQLLSAKQGALMCNTPLTLAETASVFGEMLTFQKLLADANNPDDKKMMLANKVEDMLNTVVRQIAFHDFETKLHSKRKVKELTNSEISDIWLATQQQSFGDSVQLDDLYNNYWAYIPHFIHSPFYVYAYAFGDCLVNALYGVYQNSDSKADFADKYLELLSFGGTKHHSELLQPFGLSLTDASFWQNGLDVIIGYIDQLEQS
jgi:oligoendopeptidase F